MNENQRLIYGLIGKTLRHSFSKKYFTQKFIKESLDNCEYNNYELVDISEFSILTKNTPGLEGLNVTIPYKGEVIPYLNKLDEATETIGAVNTIKLIEGKLYGYNTDVIGFENSLKPLLQKHHTKAIILGTGGAANAVKYVFAKMGIEFISVSRSTKENAITYTNIDETILKNYYIIINTTPLGTFPNVEEYPKIPYKHLTKKHLLYDLVYNPAETLFLKKGKEKGATIKNGLQMLKLQAEASWEIWNS